MTKTMFIKHLITGILSSLVLLAGCTNNIPDVDPPITSSKLFYENSLEVPVSLEGNWIDDVDGASVPRVKVVSLEPGENYYDSYSLMGGEPPFYGCESVRIIINNSRELSYARYSREVGSIYALEESYVLEEESYSILNFTYYINQDIYDLATPIAE